MGHRMVPIAFSPDLPPYAAVQFEIELFDFFYRSKRLTDYIYTDIYWNYRNALDRLCIHLNIILLLIMYPPELKDLQSFKRIICFGDALCLLKLYIAFLSVWL